MVSTFLRCGLYIGRRPCLYRSLSVYGSGSSCVTNSCSGTGYPFSTVLVRSAPIFLKTSVFLTYRVYSNCTGSKDEDEDYNNVFFRTYAEFSNYHNYLMRHPRPSRLVNDQIEDFSHIPQSLDWRTRGAVTVVKRQDGRGCCWAFAVAACIESYIQIQTGTLRSLSVEQLVQHAYEDRGTEHGGQLALGFAYVVVLRGLTSWKAWPFGKVLQVGERCISAATIDGFKIVRPYDENMLRLAVAKQPVAVSVHCSDELYNYTGGIFRGPCSGLASRLDHSLVIVGYGTSNDGFDFWLCKNCYGSDWGENGYIRIWRNTKNDSGLCGIAIEPMYPI